MHTSLSPRFSLPPFDWSFSLCIRPAALLIRPAALLLMIGLLLQPSPAAGQADFPGVPDTTSVNFRAYLADFFGRRVGPGIGVGMVVHNLARQNDQWLLTAAPAIFEQVATLSFASANPDSARRYVLADVRGLHTDRDWVGVRPGIERSSLHGRIRVGQAFLDHRLLVQPHVTVSHHSIDHAYAGGAHPSGHQFLFPRPSPQQTGVRPGIDLQFDTRNQSLQPTSGLLLQGTWAHYTSLDATSVNFDQIELDAYGYVPLGGLHRLAGRLSGIGTHSRGSDPVPIYMQPRLDGSLVPGLGRGQDVGMHRLLGSVLYRFPLKRILGFSAIEGHLGVHLANVYDDLGPQFSPSVSFDENPSYEDGRPFLPAASAGLRFVAPARDRAILELAVGASPSGVTGVRFSFRRSLQALRPPHHTLDHRW